MTHYYTRCARDHFKQLSTIELLAELELRRERLRGGRYVPEFLTERAAVNLGVLRAELTSRTSLVALLQKSEV